MIILKQDFVGLVVYIHYNYFPGRWIRPAFDILLGHADAVLDNIDEDGVFNPKKNYRMFGKLQYKLPELHIFVHFLLSSSQLWKRIRML